MSRGSNRRSRPSEIVMDELFGQADPWDIDKHLNGCLAAYQASPRYGTAVYFALEAILGIARDIEVRAEAGELDPSQLDPDWTVSPKATVPVPWIWVRSLARAWSKYRTDGGPLGQAFGLEGGQGQPPVDTRLARMLDERAIARWISERVAKARLAGERVRIEDAIHEAADKFNKSDVSIRRAWQRFRAVERARLKK